jgi:putative tricarboxylic transport membrane protein
VTVATPGAPHRRNASAVAVGLAVVALGGFVLEQAITGPAALGYAQVGPGVFPTIIGSALVFVGLALLLQAWRAHWHVVWTEADGTPSDSRAASPALSLLLIGAGLVADVVLMAPLGFVLASTALFACVTAAFGSRRLVRDLAIGLVFTGAIVVVFSRGLGLDLPAGRVWEGLLWTH